MNKEELENANIGEDKPQVEPKQVIIEDYRIEEVTNKEGKEIGQKLVLLCKHPDVTDRLIEISSVKYQQDDKIKQSGTWVKLDDNKQLPYRSAVATFLRSTGKNSIKELKGMTVNTVTQDNGYLAFKGY